MTIAAEADDLKVTLAAATQVPVLDLGEIKALGTPPARYVELHLAPRFGGEQRVGGTRGTRLRRLTTRVLAKDYDDGQLIAQRIRDTFDPNVVTIDGRPVLVSFESGDAFGEDDGWWSSATDWTY